MPTIPDEYEKLGSYAMAGLPESSYPTRLVPEGQLKSAYGIIIGGRNFGCGSSREHAPIALGAAGVHAVIAESFTSACPSARADIQPTGVETGDIHAATGH